MNTAWADVLSRLHDGEVVDADVVAKALESHEMRLLLVDFVRLRATFRTDRAEPSGAFYAHMVRTLRPARGRVHGRRVALRIAAALIAAALLAGLGVESWQRWRAGEPPRPSRVLRFEASEWVSSGGSGS